LRRHPPERPRAPLPTSEPTTTRQHSDERASSRSRSPSRQRVGADSVIAAAPVSRRIVDAAAAAHHAPAHAAAADTSADPTMQMPDAARRVNAMLGVVAPEDPNVPPLPPHEDDRPTARKGSRPPPAPKRPSRPPAADADGTITRAKPPTQQALADVAPTQPSPVSLRTEARQRMGAMPVPDQPTVPMMERPAAPISSERSSDFASEAQRLSEEAKVNAEAARIAGRMAEASARAAALAAEAAMLAARGERHDAVQKLREAQLVDEALKRGELPPSVPLAPDKDLVATGHHPRVSVRGESSASRLWVPVVVAVALLSMVAVVVVVLLM